MPRARDIAPLAASAPLPVAVYAATGQASFAAISIIAPIVGIVATALRRLNRRSSNESGIDIDTLFLFLHMYSVSTGRPGRRRLFELNTLLAGYGELQRLLRRIAVIAVEWGYGFVRATRTLAREVANEYVKGFLIRFSEVLRTGEDVTRFLRAELATTIRQYVGAYGRSVDLLRIFLGLYATLMSTSAFILLTFTVLSLFIGKNIYIYIVSLIAITSVMTVFILVARLISPRDPVVYRGREARNPRLDKLRSTVRIAALGALAAGIAVYYVTRDPLWTIAGFSVPAMLPGIRARRMEAYVKRLNQFFNIFVRSFGLTFSVQPNYASALSSVLAADYGPLTPYLQRLYSRITNGIDPHVAFRMFASETASYDVVRGSNIIVDTIDAGGDMAETGIVLNNVFIRINDLRRDRERLAGTFETVVYLMQGLVAAIASAVVNLLAIFSKFYQQLATITTTAGAKAAITYMPITLTAPPLNTIAWTTAIFLASLILINAILITYIRGSIMEIALFHAAILAIVTVVSAKAMEIAAHILVIPLALPTRTF